MVKKKLTSEDVLHLADLAKLKLADAEVMKLLGQLEETLTYVDNLNELHEEAAKNLITTTNVTFEDGAACERQLTKEEALENSKSKKDQFFTVKRIL